MTSAMDDALGHIAFFAGEGPWQGATVQVNTKLQKPVRVGQFLKLEATIVKREGRKVHVAATLVDADGAVYASMEGLSIAGVKMGDHNDAVAMRRWESSEDGMRDSGWAL
jgi:acyl-coenzyme A thioesterase PaaI-like protein